MAIYSDNTSFLISTFQNSLRGAALAWYITLDMEDFTKWEHLTGEFVRQYKFKLRHKTSTTFSATFFEPHGYGDFETGKGIVWEEDDDDILVVFEFGLDGKQLDTVGIELEEEMPKAARNKGEEFWKEGLIWYEKIK